MALASFWLNCGRWSLDLWPGLSVIPGADVRIRIRGGVIRIRIRKAGIRTVIRIAAEQNAPKLTAGYLGALLQIVARAAYSHRGSTWEGVTLLYLV